MPSDRHKRFPCKICGRINRSDKLTQHLKTHERKHKYPMKTCNICQKLMISWHLPRHMKIHSDDDILKTINEDQCKYENKKIRGGVITDLVIKEKIDPESLRPEFKVAININNLYKERSFGSLKPWQEKLFNILEPSDREIIWVIGSRGNEGKTWFQEYVEHYYGKCRVFQTTIDRHRESILHTLSKKTLPLIEYFLFNIPKGFNRGHVPYSLFEEIKDGRAISTKYDSKELRFRVPNIIVVFSNTIPNFIKSVSKDRWTVCTIQYGLGEPLLIKKHGCN